MSEILSVSGLGLAALAFLIGSIPFAVVVSRVLGLSDPRSYGSGNPGATNVLRSGDKRAALLTLLGDVGKGTLVVLAAKALAQSFQISDASIALIGLAVFLGHIFSVFLRFKGGKGVATAAGVLLGVNIWLGLATLGVWIAIVKITRYSSAGALAAALAAPALAYVIIGVSAWLPALIAMSALLIWRHKENIQRLLAGTEGRLGARPKPDR